ncbi:MAG: hypothetical protein IPO21_04040 [Bacteroidales bacterium]|nr:hypothetical protein [Bacteroidales bacterium]
MDIKRDIVLRMGIVYVLIVIFAIIIIAKIIHLQFIEGDSLRAQARKPKQNIVEAKRGDILDRNGKILTTSVPFYHVYFDPRIDYFKKHGNLFTDSVKALAAGLSEIFNESSQLATTRYYNNKLMSVYSNQKLLLIKRKISYPQLKRVKALPIFNKGSYKGGLIINPEHIRVKPYKDLAYRTLGYLQENAKKNIVGRVGLERAFENELCGENGFKFYGNSPDVDDNNMRIIPKDGYNVVSSIDIDIQDIAHSILKNFIVEIEARYGCVVVMEVATGDVLAIANIGKNAQGEYTETFNYAVGTKAEPGSTFKIMSMMAALEDGVVTPTTLIKTGDGSIKIYDKTIQDIIKDKGDKGTITAREVIKFSSNVGIVKIITENYDKRRSDFINRLYNMGLNQKLGIPRRRSESGY